MIGLGGDEHPMQARCSGVLRQSFPDPEGGMEDGKKRFSGALWQGFLFFYLLESIHSFFLSDRAHILYLTILYDLGSVIRYPCNTLYRSTLLISN